MTLKPKRRGFGIQMKTFEGRDGQSYLVFRTDRNSYHVFVEVEAKEAARQCGVTREGTTQQMWSEIWSA